MVNMYSLGMMGGMNGMYGSNGVRGNVHQNFKGKYGVGYEDFGNRPYAQPYPMAITPRQPNSLCNENAFCRFIKKILI